MDDEGLLPVLRRWWRVIAVAGALAAIVGFVIAARSAEVFEARARLLVGPINTDIDTLRASSQLAQTYAELATSKPVLDSTASSLGLTGRIDDAVSATANNTTRLLTIRARDRDPARAAAIANGIGDQLSRLSTRGTNRIEGGLQRIERAEVPTMPVEPRRMLTAVLAGPVGALLAFGVLLVVDKIRGAVRSTEDLAEATNLEILATLPLPRTQRSGFEVERFPESITAASFQLLAAKVEPRITIGGNGNGNGKSPSRVLLVVGADVARESAEVAANLAAVLARHGHPVTLVDAESETRAVTSMLGLSERPGIAELMANPALLSREKAALGHFTVDFPSPPVTVVPSGRSNGRGPVDGAPAAALLALLGHRSEVVVLHAAPASRSPSALTWARYADASLIVARRDRTSRVDVRRSIESLRQVNANLIGGVLVGR